MRKKFCKHTVSFFLVLIFATISLTISASAYCPDCGRETPVTWTDFGTYKCYVCDVCGHNFGISSGGDSGGGSSTPTTIQLDTPSVSASMYSSSAISVSWNYISNADYYSILYSYYTGLGRRRVSHSSETTTTSTSIRLTGLLSDTTYYITVTAHSNSASYTTSNSSSQVTATTDRAITYVSAPTLTCTPTTNSIAITWSATAATANYTLQYSTNSSMSGATSETITGTSYTISGLTPKTNYYIRIRSNVSGAYYASNGFGSTYTIKTLQIPLGTPRLSSLHMVNCNNIDVSFSSVENATGYIIEYSTDELFSNKQALTV